VSVVSSPALNYSWGRGGGGLDVDLDQKDHANIQTPNFDRPGQKKVHTVKELFEKKIIFFPKPYYRI
jgi:hypothetical protein